MRMISFAVDHVPVAQPRQRHRVATSGGRTFAQNYVPQDHPVHVFKLAAIRAAKEAMHGQHLFAGAVSLEATFMLPLPKSKARKPPVCVTTKPDLDNLYKALTDAMNGICYGDDRQIARAVIAKIYCVVGSPRVDVKIMEIENE